MIALFNQAGAAIARINTLADVAADPLIASRLVRARDPRTGTEIAISPPPVIPDHLRRQQMRLSFPPRLGEHNEAIFGSLGYDVSKLGEDGIV